MQPLVCSSFTQNSSIFEWKDLTLLILSAHPHDVGNRLKSPVRVGWKPLRKDKLERQPEGIERPKAMSVVSQEDKRVRQPGVAGHERPHAAPPEILQSKSELPELQEIQEREQQS